MTIRDITDIHRKENFIYYRREFTGSAQYELPGRRYSGRIEFTIETTPLGTKDISVKIIDQVDYPTLPILRSLKECILRMDTDGVLP